MNQMHSVDSLMTQVEMFACAYATIGGPFDQGAAVENAQKEKAVLREMLTAVLAVPPKEVQADPVDWDELPEDAHERARFDRNLKLYGGDPRVAIATALRLLANVGGNGSFGQMCAIYANEVAKMHITAPQAQPVDAQLERLQALINSPELHNFLRGTHLEAVHQVERWGEAPDRKKRPADWFWLVGYLAGKALHAADSGNQDKALHHCISTAAALYNWHCAIKGQDVRQLPAMSDVEQIINQAFPGEANAEQ